MSRLSFRLLRFSKRAAALLALCALSALGAHADQKSDQWPYDGVWQTTLSCVNASGALGYSFKFPSSVKDGVLHGQKGTAHEAGWLSIDGSIAADGAADLYVDGLVGASAMAVGQRPVGTQYGYHVAARFSGDRAEGHRVEGRPCTVAFEREK
jgi:hypothetical protein